MKKLLTIFLLIAFCNVFSQNLTTNPLFKRSIKVDDLSLRGNVLSKRAGKSASNSNSISITTINGEKIKFTLSENNISENKLKAVTTFDGESIDHSSKIKLSYFSDSFNAIIKTPEGYFYIEPDKFVSGNYVIYDAFRGSDNNFACGINKEIMDEAYNLSKKTPNLKAFSVTNFPYGNKLRVFRMAIATTGEFTQAFGGNQDNALAEAVNVLNLINLIYETELSMTFRLVPETTNKTLIFTDPATDPFTVDANFASAANSQTGFNTLNSNGTLPYANYDIGHTFNIITASSIRGQAGPQPCSSNLKARAWSEWILGANKGSTANVIVHEMGHQFSAWHTYNANGGSTGSPTFCTSGWSSTTAVEPGGGSTIMGYNSNCQTPNNQTNTGNNMLNYFNAKSLDQILSNLSSSATCYTQESSTNSLPSANAGVDITIPKNTPFRLKGIATDANNTALSYTWEQSDVATANDQGAFGNTINGVGGYTAANSTTAPLFRSEQSTSTTERYFPKLKFVINNQNTPPVNEAEVLPLVARTLNFRFTVRDNFSKTGGVDSDDIAVTVSNDGPLAVSYPNATGVSVNSGSNVAVTWSVNNTNNIKNVVNILLSVDGGYTYPYTLATNVANNGSYTVTIPTVPNTTTARIKVVGVINNYAEFFDISDNNFAITSSCNAYSTYISPTTAVSTTQGSSAANLNMTAPSAASTGFNSFSLVHSPANATNTAMLTYSDATMTAGRVAVSSYPTYNFKFRVSASGSYKFTNSTGGFFLITIQSGSPFTTGNFVGSNTYFNGSSYNSYTSTNSLNLVEGTDYYFVGSDFTSPAGGSTFNIDISGPGSIYKLSTAPSGYSYTFAAIDANGKIIALSTTADFTSLPVGTYTITGISYDSTANTSTFINKTISELSLSGVCLYQSNNTRDLKINATMSVNESNSHDIRITPNPTDNFIEVVSKTSFESYEIHDLSGRLVINNKFSNRIDVRNLKSGVYIIKLKGEKTYTTKFIKK